MEGDEVRVLARVHNLSEYEGPVDLTLTIASGTLEYGRYTERMEIGRHETAEMLFSGFTTPSAGEVTVTVAAKAGPHSDALLRTMEAYPWGMPYAAHGGGVSSTHADVSLELPRGLPYTSTWMRITVGPDLRRTIIDMALGNGDVILPPRPIRGQYPVSPGLGPLWGASPASELLAAVSGLEYARSLKAPRTDQLRLESRTRSHCPKSICLSPVSPSHSLLFAHFSPELIATGSLPAIATRTRGNAACESSLPAVRRTSSTRRPSLPWRMVESSTTQMRRQSSSNESKPPPRRATSLNP